MGCTLLDFHKVEVCPRTLKASVSWRSWLVLLREFLFTTWIPVTLHHRGRKCTVLKRQHDLMAWQITANMLNPSWFWGVWWMYCCLGFSSTDSTVCIVKWGIEHGMAPTVVDTVSLWESLSHIGFTSICPILMFWNNLEIKQSNLLGSNPLSFLLPFIIGLELCTTS